MKIKINTQWGYWDTTHHFFNIFINKGLEYDVLNTITALGDEKVGANRYAKKGTTLYEISSHNLNFYIPQEDVTEIGS